MGNNANIDNFLVYTQIYLSKLIMGVVENGSIIRLWLDVWLKETPLKNLYPYTIYKMG